MRPKRLLIAGAVVVAVIAAAWAGREAYATARIGATYVAKQTCSCLFVARRPFESCLTDYSPRDLAALTLEPAPTSVTVSALAGFVSARADFEEGYGCHPVN